MTLSFIPKKEDRSNNFSFLRLVFASLVILSHSFELVDGNRHRELLTSLFGTLSFGEFAVDGFFLLSGYLIVQSWLSQPQPLLFVRKRVLRIYPAFIVCSIFCALIVGPLASSAVDYFSQFQVAKFIAGSFVLNRPLIPPVFIGQVNGAMWTIQFEFLCYLSVLLFGVLSLFKKRFFWLLSAIILTLLFINVTTVNYVVIHLTQHLSNHTTSYILFYSNQFIRLAMFFFVGGSFYLYKEFVPFNRTLACLSLLTLFALMFNKYCAEVALAFFGGYILFFIAFTKFTTIDPFRKLPDISYGLYLYSWPVQKLIIWYIVGISPWLVFVLTFLISACLGTLSWYGIEKPFLKLKYINNKRSAARLQPNTVLD